MQTWFLGSNNTMLALQLKMMYEGVLQMGCNFYEGFSERERERERKAEKANDRRARGGGIVRSSPEATEIFSTFHLTVSSLWKP